MSKNYFTPEQVEQLRKNKYVKHVLEKSITYTEEFKEVFKMEYNSGKLPSQILTEMGFNYKALGKRTPVEYRIYLLEGRIQLLHKKEAESTNVQSASI